MSGKVYLVGAGPGDFELMTLKGASALKKAEVLIYDRLASLEFLKMVPKNCELIYVGKKSAEHTLQQEDINDLLIEKAQEGKCVVRLKGGDPYVFGRGGEEGEALYEKGIDFEVIPGITSAIGGLAYAGIPITHRDYASSFHVITGHLKSDEKDHDWQAIAAYEGTLVFLMGLSNLSKIKERLMTFGKSGTTPAALVEWATTPRQRKLVSTLEELPNEAERLQFQSPSLIVIGDVVSAHVALDTQARKPLYGKTVAVTRGRDQASGLVADLRELGAVAIETPMIRIEGIDSDILLNAVTHIKEYSHLIFTSVNGVQFFFKALWEAGKDTRSLSHLTCTVIGSATYEALLQKGIKADHMPETFVAESVWQVLEPHLTSKDKVLIPRAKGARPFLVDVISKVCPVDEIPIYEALPDASSIMDQETQGRVDFITFTSSSTVKHFFEIYGQAAATLLKRGTAVSIGPITTETLRAFGVMNSIEADVYTTAGITEALLKEVKNHA
jgi:uroporphyrinogen III methyltransferase/synthase